MNAKQDAFESAKSFERQITLKDEQSKKTAWMVASVAVGFAFLCLCALLVALPLKHTELTIVRVDNITGRTEVLTTVTNEDVTQQAAQDKFFVSQYVKLRERYNYYSSQTDYDTVPYYSSEAVASDYIALWGGDQAPDKIYQDAANVVTVDIISNPVVEGNFPDKISTVRFAKHVKNLRSGQIKTDYYIARVTFRMDPPKVMTEEIRTTNPLGFTVVEYLVEKEMRGGE